MDPSPTTRMGLQGAGARLQVARRGATLLRGKRQVLAGELFRVVREVLAGRARLDEVLREAARALVVARSMEGDDALESLALAAAREIPVEAKRRRVWGVAVAEVVAPRLVRSASARGTSPLGWGLAATEAARRHEQALEILLAIASRELYLGRLGEEIRETSRRINALEQIEIPRLARDVARIRLALEERSREDAVRVRRSRAHLRRRSR